MQPAYREFKNGAPFRINEEDPDIIHHFIDINKKMPSTYQVSGTFIYEEWLNHFKESYPDHIVSWKMEAGDYRQAVIQVRIDKYVVFIRSGHTKQGDPGTFKLTDAQNEYVNNRGIICFCDIDVFYDPEYGVPTDLVKSLHKIRMADNEQINKIHLVCQDPDIGFYTKELPIKGTDYNFDLDLHYGDGMQEFHDKQIKRLKSGSKGIILFYGDPGTGKSTYIKRLCKDLFEVDKKILYLPNRMVDNIGTPSFNNFLLDWSDDQTSDQKKGILIIIEDGERVLLKREENPFGADGVSNILNSTDGIMNDFLNIQILATFNTSIDKIDSAILRKKRALGIREFKNLSIENAQHLVDHLGIDLTVTKPMPLADIYALIDEDEDVVLFKDGSSKKLPERKIGFNQ